MSSSDAGTLLCGTDNPAESWRAGVSFCGSVRVSNLPTSGTQPLAVMLFVAIVVRTARLRLTLAQRRSFSSLFYCGREVPDDVSYRKIDSVERPDRPIPAECVGAIVEAAGFCAARRRMDGRLGSHSLSTTLGVGAMLSALSFRGGAQPEPLVLYNVLQTKAIAL